MDLQGDQVVAGGQGSVGEDPLSAKDPVEGRLPFVAGDVSLGVRAVADEGDILVLIRR